jgi:hypothetical protein
LPFCCSWSGELLFLFDLFFCFFYFFFSKVPSLIPTHISSFTHPSTPSCPCHPQSGRGCGECIEHEASKDCPHSQIIFYSISFSLKSPVDMLQRNVNVSLLVLSIRGTASKHGSSTCHSLVNTICCTYKE